MSGYDAERERGDEHEVTSLELFFDLTFVFAMTQGHDPAGGRPENESQYRGGQHRSTNHPIRDVCDGQGEFATQWSG
jgi:hypothetical protein